MKSVLIIVSALNEAAAMATALPILIQEVAPFADVLVISDGSTDETAAVARQCGVSVIDMRENRGKLACVRDAMRLSIDRSYRYFLTFDADGQHDPKSVPAIMNELERGYDVVFASRYRKDCPPGTGRPPLDRELLNIACRAMVEKVTGWGLTDPLCGMRGFTRQTVQWLLQQTYASQDGYGLEIETVIRLWHRHSHQGLAVRFAEVPIPAIYNGDGKISQIYDDAYLDIRLDRIKAHHGHLVRTLRSLGITHLDELERRPH